MHAEAQSFVAEVVPRLGPFKRVAELGSLDINGSVRPLFGHCEYLGIDRVAGPGVDLVIDASEWIGQGYDAVVCCEVLEHVPNPESLIASAFHALKPEGWLILTCAGPGREPHSGTDGGALKVGEHYANVQPEALGWWLEDFGFSEVIQQGNDVYATARK